MLLKAIPSIVSFFLLAPCVVVAQAQDAASPYFRLDIGATSIDLGKFDLGLDLGTGAPAVDIDEDPLGATVRPVFGFPTSAAFLGGDSKGSRFEVGFMSTTARADAAVPTNANMRFYSLQSGGVFAELAGFTLNYDRRIELDEVEMAWLAGQKQNVGEVQPYLSITWTEYDQDTALISTNGGVTILNEDLEASFYGLMFGLKGAHELNADWQLVSEFAVGPYYADSVLFVSDTLGSGSQSVISEDKVGYRIRAKVGVVRTYTDFDLGFHMIFDAMSDVPQGHYISSAAQHAHDSSLSISGVVSFAVPF